MIHYHGSPITPEKVAIAVLPGRHACVSFCDTRDLDLIARVCQSFIIDNGAFSMWRANKPVTDWRPFYEWVRHWLNHPACDWAVIPDVIGGTESENDALLNEWPFGQRGVPVWHLNESIDRLVRLAGAWPRIALGSAKEYDVRSPRHCLTRLGEALPAICDEDGTPVTKLHGLRMLRSEIVTRVPLSSADSTNIARNVGYDKAWVGRYKPVSLSTRALVLAERIEQHQSPADISGLYAPEPMLWEYASLERRT